MGGRESYVEQLIRFEEVPAHSVRDGRVDLLLEPVVRQHEFQIGPIYEMAHTLGWETVADLRHYVWVRVDERTASSIAQRDDSFQETLLNELANAGVARIWPNNPLEPQGYSYSAILEPVRPPEHEVLGHIGPHGIEESDGAGITWAIVDTEIASNHELFDGMDIERYAVEDGLLVAKAGHPDLPLPSSHGTHIAGLIASMAPKVRLICVALPNLRARHDDDATKFGDEAADRGTAELEAALEWLAARPDVDGINLSLGVLPSYQDVVVGRQPGCAGATDCVTSGKVVVVSSGNYGEMSGSLKEFSITDPANAQDVLVVGACSTTEPYREGIWTRSSRGPTADGRIKPDIVAPGVDISSSGAGYRDEYLRYSGTSQAAAIVSGALAALMSRQRSGSLAALLSQHHVEELDASWWMKAAKDSASDLKRDQTYQGSGILDSLRLSGEATKAILKAVASEAPGRPDSSPGPNLSW